MEGKYSKNFAGFNNDYELLLWAGFCRSGNPRIMSQLIQEQEKSKSGEMVRV